MMLKKWFCCILFLFPCLSQAVTTHIYPVRLMLESGETKTSFKVINEDAKPVSFQLRAVKWEKQGEKDIYTDTSDIIINPPIITLAPDDYQMVRVGVRASLNPNKEHAYRIFLREIDSTPAVPSSKEKKLSVTTLAEFRLPLFIAPKTSEKDIDISFKSIGDDEVQVKMVNNSNRHIQVKNIEFYSADAKIERKNILMSFNKDISVYLFPHEEKTWTLAWKPETMKDVIVRFRTDWGNFFEPERKDS